MKKNPFAVALKAKGFSGLYDRARSIVQRYGLSSGLMDRALTRFSEVLRQFDCGATFPITAVTLGRHGSVIEKYLNQNIEFAVHGYTHVDYSRLEPEIQRAHLQKAREVFARAGIAPEGFRSPYLSRDGNLPAVLAAAGFSYVSNQPFVWDALSSINLSSSAIANYERALNFYDPWLASERLSLPRLEDHLVEIPVSLPDDEILIERLGGENGIVKDAWQQILTQTYQRGELFTLQLHPERISLCADALSAVLAEARALAPAVWFARLDEISAWWQARFEATIELSEDVDGACYCVVRAPNGTTVLARGVEMNAPNIAWANGYRVVEATRFTIHTPLRPVIGLSPSTAPGLASFLRQQGFIIETSTESGRYSCFFERPAFDASQERSILVQIEGSGQPLLRLGRWPNGAQSALAVTGDIDALALWDYALRMIGK